MAKKLSAAEILAAAKAAPVPPPAPPKPVHKQHELRVEATDPQSIYEATVNFWQTIVSVAQTTLAPESWDIIICDLMDSGWIGAEAAKCELPFYFPRHYRELDKPEHEGRSEHFRFPKEWEEVELHIKLHEQQLEEAAHSCEEDAEYDREFQRLAVAKIQLLRATANDARLADQWKSLPSLRGVFAIIESYTLHESNLFHVFGEALPPPAPPQTALEVFSRLLHHTHSGVGKSCGLKFDRDELVAVDLSSANTTDETLALLDDVPNLPELCQHVRQIDLTHSAVTKRGFAKLATMLPHVQILR